MLLALIVALVSQPRLYTPPRYGFYFKPTPMIMGRAVKISHEMSLRSYVYLDEHGNWHQAWMPEFKMKF